MSRIEHGTRAATADDLRVWCAACQVSPERCAELLAEQRAVAGMWITYQRSHRAGLRQAQAAVRPVYERATLLLLRAEHVPWPPPDASVYLGGLTAVRDKLSLPVDDVAEAVAERMDRQKVLRFGRRRFVFVIEEQVLAHRTVPLDVHAGQLRHLLVLVGIIPASAPRSGVWPVEAFYMFDQELMAIELVSGVLEVTQPGEVAMYLRSFSTMEALAVLGDSARALITAALEALPTE